MRAAILLLLAGASASAGPVTRIKDIATVSAVSAHKLMGYGLVVGLQGTGDGSRAVFTAQSLANMLERFGVSVDARELRVKNVAAVMVVAELPAQVDRGARLDVLLSSLGDATSLQGGTLLATPLLAGDGQMYALAQGPVSIGGFNVSSGGDSVQQNHAVVGRVPGGATVSAPVSGAAVRAERFCLVLHSPDFTTACRVADAIGAHAGVACARALGPALVEVTVPAHVAEPVRFITELEQLAVEPDTPARVVINERTGTVVIGERVRIAPVAISHGSLTIQVRAQWQVSQPPPLSHGDTVVVPAQNLQVEEGGGQVLALPPQGSLDELVAALNVLGVKPRDLIAIIQALRSAGALEAEVVVQ